MNRNRASAASRGFARTLLPLLACLTLTLGVSLHGADVATGTTTHAAPATAGLLPIAPLLTQIDLAPLAALPVQHGGRYKPVQTLAMELVGGVTGGTPTLGDGHTPLSSLLDLLFCRSDYDQRPIIVIKNAELARDIALALPADARERVADDHRLTPLELGSMPAQDALDRLGRLTAKTKAINQVRIAGSNLDPATLDAALRLIPLPAGPHSDRWRSPSDIAPSLAAALEDFRRRAAAANGAMNAFATVPGAALPLDDRRAERLRFDESAQRSLNMDCLWPLWQAAARATAPLDAAAIAALADNPQKAADLGLPTSVTTGLTRLRTAWSALRPAADDCATPELTVACTTAAERASAAWADLGAAWADARHGGRPDRLQPAIAAVVTAATDLRDLLARDHAARGTPMPVLRTTLELTYWKWNGFTGVAWCFLFAVPLLALGNLGRMRLALIGGLALFALGAVGQVVAFLIRWQLAERIPLANLYESMAAASLVASLVAVVVESVILWRRRNGSAAGIFACAAALFGCIIVMSQAFLERNDINAFISPAMPILSEFWLRVHTSCVVASYGIIGLAGLMSLIYLIMRIRLPWDDARCVAWDRTAFILDATAAVVLWAGLVLGAVWAAVSWGRPWGWDPKEVFALLTWIVFVILIHLRLAVPPERRGLATAAVGLTAFLVMAFNWYFVNVKLAGLHSYA
jgi:ABC-type transport system involved in cytochrome c biogenesis permease subunit